MCWPRLILSITRFSIKDWIIFFGIDCLVFSCVKSYLDQRPSFVKICTMLSFTEIRDTGVPQGSLLGRFWSQSIMLQPQAHLLTYLPAPQHSMNSYSIIVGLLIQTSRIWLSAPQLAYISAICKGYFIISWLFVTSVHPCLLTWQKLDLVSATVWVGVSDANFTKLEQVQYTLAHVFSRMSRIFSWPHQASPRQTALAANSGTSKDRFEIHLTKQSSYLAGNQGPCAISCRQSLLKESTITLTTSARDFHHIMAKTWNSLPCTISGFRYSRNV